MGNVAHCIQPGHVLLLEEIDRMAFPFGEQRHKDVGAGDLLPSRALYMQDGALDHPLEPSGGSGFGVAVGGDEVLQLVVEVFAHLLTQYVHFDVAGFKDGQCILIIQQPDEQML
jgi:hypothetical protein